jgi:hypothetical protein
VFGTLRLPRAWARRQPERLQPRSATPDSESLARLSVADRRKVVVSGTSALGRSPLCPPHDRSLGPEEIDAHPHTTQHDNVHVASHHPVPAHPPGSPS